jgi:G3E family GTPase
MGEIDPDKLFGVGLEATGARAAKIQDWLQEDAYGPNHGHDHGHDHGHSHDGDEDGDGDGPHESHYDDRINTFSVRFTEPVHPTGLKLWLDILSTFRGPNLLRVKGLLNINGEPVVVHAVQHLFHDPYTLPAWPDDDHSSRIVFITYDLDRAEVEDTLKAFRFAPEAPRADKQIDPRNYAKFVEAMSHFRTSPNSE